MVTTQILITNSFQDFQGLFWTFSRIFHYEIPGLSRAKEKEIEFIQDFPGFE